MRVRRPSLPYRSIPDPKSVLERDKCDPDRPAGRVHAVPIELASDPNSACRASARMLDIGTSRISGSARDVAEEPGPRDECDNY